MSEGLYIQRIRVPEGTQLRKKDTFEYVTPDNTYLVEVYMNHDGTCYAVGVPQEGDKLIVYGTNFLPTAELALQSVIDKIHGHGLSFEVESEQSADGEDGDSGSH